MSDGTGYTQSYGQAFARAYNERWSFFAQRTTPVLLDYFDQTGIPDGPILDLCCGTGQSASIIYESGRSVTGIDLSEHMLKLATGNNERGIAAGAIRFVRGDASDFQIDERFAAAISLFDAMNHLSDVVALASAFSQVHHHLMDNGCFIFDMNTEVGLSRWNGINVSDDDEMTVINRGIYAPGAERAYTSITGFVRDADGRYTKFSEIAFNSVYPATTVLQSLRDAGFTHAYPASIDDLATANDAPDSLRRVFYVARK